MTGIVIATLLAIITHLSLGAACPPIDLPVFRAILPGFADIPIQRLPQLTPAAWTTLKS